MRVLFFSPRGCRVPNTGAKLRNYHLCRLLAQRAHVTYLSFADDPAAPFSDEDGGELAQRIIAMPRGGGISPFKVARGIVGPLPFTVLNYTTPAMQEQLAKVLREEPFDAVQVEGMVLAGYLPQLHAAPNRPLLVCDWHNVDSELMRRYSQHAPDALRGAYARLTSKRINALERNSMDGFDAHLTVSDRDTEYVRTLGSKKPVFTVENGTDISGWETQDSHPASKRNRIVFVGSMDYHPNNDAVLYFAEQVWPLIHRQRPDWIFTVVGRDPSPAVQALNGTPGTEVTGTVPEVRPYYLEAVASVVPLRIGGGSRLKILESFAARVPVVSTRLGAEGLAVRDGEHLLLRDTPDALSQALLGIENDPQLPKRLEVARTLAVTRYDWAAIGTQIWDIYDQLLQNHRNAKPNKAGASA